MGKRHRHIRDPTNIVEPKHHCGSVRVLDPGKEVRSEPGLVVDRLGHVARVVWIQDSLGSRILLDRSRAPGS